MTEEAVVGSYVWAFQYCHCIHESSYATMSLHTTEKGAEMAMEFHKEVKRKEFHEWGKQIDNYSFNFGDDEGWNIYRFTLLK